MTSPNLQDWFYVELTLKSLSDGSSTTRRFSNRAIIDDSIEYYPLLRNISGVGSRMSDYLPYSISGQISIDITEGSFEYERRFCDYLERYTIIDQSVKIYAAQTELDDLNVTSDFSLVATARAVEWSIDNSSKLLNITISGNQIKPRFVTKIIDSAAFPNAPSASLGKAIPLVFGTAQEVPAIRVAADGDTTPEYVYQTTLAGTFQAGSPDAYYTRDGNGKFSEVVGVNVVSTAFIDYSSGSKTGSLIAANPPTAWRLQTSAHGYIATQFELICRGYNIGGGSYSGDFVVSIYDHNDASDGPGRELGRCTFDKTNLAANMRGSAEYTLAGTFNRPIPLTGSTYYYLGWNEGYTSSDQVRVAFEDLTGASGVAHYYRPSAQLNNPQSDGWRLAGTATDYPWYRLYGVKMLDGIETDADADGFGYKFFELSQKTAISGFTNPDLTDLEFIVGADGITDDVSGTITGTPEAQISQPKHVVALLDREWNGSSWVAGSFDFTQFSSTHTSVSVVRGATTGRTTFEDVLTDVCKNTCSRVSSHNGASKQLSFWQWGTTQTASVVITDEDCEILNIEERGIETIVNRFTFYYDRRFRDVDFTTGSAQGEFKNYAGTLDWYASKNYLTEHYSSVSASIFGTKPAAAASFDFIADSASATRLAEFIAARAGFPYRYVELEVPFFKYRTLELLNIVEILHPALPAFYGTSAKARLPTYDGEEVDLIGGHYWKRAQRYRAQIESKEIVFNPGGISMLRLGCRLLTNSKDPT